MGLLTLDDLSGLEGRRSSTIYSPAQIAAGRQAHKEWKRKNPEKYSAFLERLRNRANDPGAEARYLAANAPQRSRPVFALDFARSQARPRAFPKLDKGRLVSCLRNCVEDQPGLSGLGQIDCGPKPGLGPGEKSICCPDLGWVIYDSSESPYALCERAAAHSGTTEAQPTGSTSDFAARLEAERRAGDAELRARRQAMEDRRIALEERQFQQRMQAVLLKAQLQRARAASAATPEAQAARRAAAEASMASASRVRASESAAQTKRLTYAAIAAVAAKLLFFS